MATDLGQRVLQTSPILLSGNRFSRSTTVGASVRVHRLCLQRRDRYLGLWCWVCCVDRSCQGRLDPAIELLSNGV